jgi:tRNA(Ile)-lysidine synthase
VKGPPPLVGKVGRRLARLGAAPDGLVVAVSGGPDSVALLRALRALGVGRLVVAHLNHRLRGPESDADERFVAELVGALAAEAHGLELRCDRIDVRARAGGDNLEAAARRLRYDWLGRVAQEAGLGGVATGHTADDQAETVLHRLLRGSGLKGLRGIAPRRPLCPGVTLLRPLLGVRRAEVLAYLEELGQPYRQDSSNLDLSRTRNRIRRELLPHLAEGYNPEVVAALGRLAEQAEEVYAAAEAEARALLAEAERPRAGALLVFERRSLAAAPRGRVREALRLVWEREGWPMAEMGFDAWERLAAVARGESAAVDLPGGVRARGRGRVVQVGRTR